MTASDLNLRRLRAAVLRESSAAGLPLAGLKLRILRLSPLWWRDGAQDAVLSGAGWELRVPDAGAELRGAVSAFLANGRRRRSWRKAAATFAGILVSAAFRFAGRKAAGWGLLSASAADVVSLGSAAVLLMVLFLSMDRFLSDDRAVALFESEPSAHERLEILLDAA